MVRYNRMFYLAISLVLLMSSCQPLTAYPNDPATAAESDVQLHTEYLFTLSIDLGPAHDVGSDSTLGIRHVAYLTGGSVEGAKVTGKVLPEGEHWFMIRQDCVCELNTHGVIQTDDGARIDFHTRAFSNVAPDLLQRLFAGEAIDPTEYALRGVPLFETDSADYAWLNESMTIATYQIEPGVLHVTVYAIR